MGRIYRPVEVEYGDRKATTVAIVDTGADETVISERLADKVNSDLYGVFKAICASDTILADKPFGTDDIDDEGVEAILGVDFLQETEMPLDFG
jgi:hypothetical protein